MFISSYQENSEAKLGTKSINLNFFMCIIFTVLIQTNSNNEISLCLELGYCSKTSWEVDSQRTKMKWER